VAVKWFSADADMVDKELGPRGVKAAGDRRDWCVPRLLTTPP